LGAETPDAALEEAWRRQSVWSQVATGLKAGVTRSRSFVLYLTVAGALLSTGAAVCGLKSTPGKALVAVGAVSVGLAGIARARSAPEAVESWTRARSASEAIKTEVYAYLTRVGDYASADRDRHLDEQIAEMEADVPDIDTEGVVPVERATPGIDGIDAYVTDRVESQISRYYREQAGELTGKLHKLRRVQLGLAVLSVLLGAVAGALEIDDIAVWVPVVTTVTTAFGAHAAAERYEFLRVEYLRTASELERLVKRWRRGTLADDQLIRACEDVISSQNERWMAKLSEKEAASG
jgi:hypothetical protein